MIIKVLGGGCKRCEALLSAAKEAVRNKGITAEIEYITDMTKIMETGVMSIPALMIDDTVVSSGKVLKAQEIEKLRSGIRYRKKLCRTASGIRCDGNRH